jgi:hypothetical protein
LCGYCGWTVGIIEGFGYGATIVDVRKESAEKVVLQSGAEDGMMGDLRWGLML